MKRELIGIVLSLVGIVLLMAMACGCGNVTLKGEALTAAKASTLDAYEAARRSGAIEATTQPAGPTWVQAYLVENFKQWRYFVRAAVKEEAWGPKLEGE